MASNLKRYLSTKLHTIVTTPDFFPWEGFTAEDIWYETGGDETEDVSVQDVTDGLNRLVATRVLELNGDKYSLRTD